MMSWKRPFLFWFSMGPAAFAEAVYQKMEKLRLRAVLYILVRDSCISVDMAVIPGTGILFLGQDALTISFIFPDILWAMK